MIVDKIEINEDEKITEDNNDNMYMKESMKEESKKKIEKVNIII